MTGVEENRKPGEFIKGTISRHTWDGVVSQQVIETRPQQTHSGRREGRSCLLYKLSQGIKNNDFTNDASTLHIEM